jgi:hypothetical protein
MEMSRESHTELQITSFSHTFRIFRSVYGKLCFGYEECSQFAQAERAGSIALEHTPNDIWAIHSITHINEETFRYI